MCILNQNLGSLNPVHCQANISHTYIILLEVWITSTWKCKGRWKLYSTLHMHADYGIWTKILPSLPRKRRLWTWQIHEVSQWKPERERERESWKQQSLWKGIIQGLLSSIIVKFFNVMQSGEVNKYHQTFVLRHLSISLLICKHFAWCDHACMSS